MNSPQKSSFISRFVPEFDADVGMILRRSLVALGWLFAIFVGVWLEQIYSVITDNEANWSDISTLFLTWSAFLIIFLLVAFASIRLFSVWTSRVKDGLTELSATIDESLEEVEKKLNFDVFFQYAEDVEDKKEEDEYQKLIRKAEKSIVIVNSSTPHREEKVGIGEEAYLRSYQLIVDKLKDKVSEKSDFKYLRVSQFSGENPFDAINADTAFRDHLFEAFHVEDQNIGAQPEVYLYLISDIVYPSTFTIIDDEWLILHATQVTQGEQELLAEIYIRDPNRRLLELFDNIVKKSVKQPGVSMVREEQLTMHSNAERFEQVFGQDIAKEIRRKAELRQQNFVEYPDFYDLLYHGEVKDIELYRRFVADCDDILECGIGTGRVALDLAKGGKRVFGIDNSAPMLERLEKRISWTGSDLTGEIESSELDMRRFTLGKRFDAAIVPFGTFNFLETDDEVASTLESIASVLKKDGKLLIELSTKETFREMINNEAGHVLRSSQNIPEEMSEFDGFNQFSVACDTIFDREKRRIKQVRSFVFLDEAGRQKSERSFVWENWLMDPKAVAAAAEQAGLCDVELWGDYGLTKPHRARSKYAVLTARLA